MNKTVNINLAGTFFHIDEDAFGKLSRYLDAIKRSLVGTEGSDEIIRDIESRMAELFLEKLESNAQVITLKELDQIIGIMGQPEDYQVDDEIFEDTPPTSQQYSRPYNSSKKQLFRDIDDKYISGVSSGLGHYIGVDAIWIRLLWVILVLAGFGTPILIYILMWIFVPAAETTSEKLKMTGEPINISNIERKFKEGFDNVADKVKNADYDKYGKKIKSSTSGFFDSLGNFIIACFKILGKLIGLFIIIISLAILISLIISLFTVGSFGVWGNGDMMEYFSLWDTTNTPFWVIAGLLFVAVGIPFFALFVLGLKLLVNNLKPMGSRAKITLFALWILSIIGLGILGVKQATEKAYQAETVIEDVLPIKSGDTLHIAMRGNKQFDYNVTRESGLQIKYNEDKEKVIYSNDIRLIVRSSKDSIGKMLIEKKADGSDYLAAKDRADAIDYNYTFENNTLSLDGYFLTDINNKYRDQEIRIILYLPVGTVIYADENTYSFHQNNYYQDDIFNNGDEGQYVKILQDGTECLDCPIETADDESEVESLENPHRTNENWESEVNKDFNEDIDTLQTIRNDSLN